jgi:hypothetical protein
MQALADKKKAITDDDLMDLVTLDQEQQQGHGQWELGYIQVKFGLVLWVLRLLKVLLLLKSNPAGAAAGPLSVGAGIHPGETSRLQLLATAVCF